MNTTQKIIKSSIDSLTKKHDGNLVAMMKEIKFKIDELDYRVRLGVTQEAEVALPIKKGLELAKKVFFELQKRHKRAWLAKRGS